LTEDDDIELPCWPVVQMLDCTPCFEGLIVVMELDT